MQEEFITLFEEISPQELNKCLQNVLFVGEKTRRPFSHCVPKLLSLATLNVLKLIIFVLNYLTVLFYTKTIIHLKACLHGGGGPQVSEVTRLGR